MSQRRRVVGQILVILLLTTCSHLSARDAGPASTTGTAASPATNLPLPDSPACQAGGIACVEDTFKEMQQRLDRLAAVCDHKAVFALTYLRETGELLRTLANPASFDDVVFVNRLDALFARFYFSALDAYAAGNLDAVPGAWRIALDQAASRQVSALGDAILGISAHINRDLPFVLAEMGIVGPAGQRRKDDYDKVNLSLVHVFGPMIEEESQRFDPNFASSKIGGQPLVGDDALALVRQWREMAFRNAERLLSAPTAAARRTIEMEIEDNAAVTARSLQLATTYPLGQTSAERDAYCAGHHA